MNITAIPSTLDKAHRQRWAAIKLSDRAFALVGSGEIQRGFRYNRASLRCTELARRGIRSAVTTARVA